MKTIGERILHIRKEAGLSMAGFGQKIGINSGSVNKLEKNQNNPSDQTIKSICREFHVNYLWLTEGQGDIYSNVGSTILEMLCEEYDLDEQDRRIMEMYLALTDDQRAGIKAFVNGMIEADKKKQGK